MIKRLELMTPGFACDHRLELQWVHRVGDRGCARIRQRVKRVKFVLDVFQAMYVVQSGRRKHHAATFFWKGFLRVPGYLVPRFLREQQYAWSIHRRDLRDSPLFNMTVGSIAIVATRRITTRLRPMCGLKCLRSWFFA